MNITVDYIDSKGTHSIKAYEMSRLAFAKHLGMAGQRYAPAAEKVLRSISMFFHYSYYLRKDDFYKNRFSSPPIALSDPTEKGQFSNLAGKAIADFLSKQIDQSLYTVNYEAAMRLKSMPITGNRPDLIAYSNKAVFAIEAKGFADGPGKMAIHKKQAKTGGIPVNFEVACVSYNMYKEIKCNYHDPFNDNIPYDQELLNSLTRNYYTGLSEFLDPRYFNYNEITVNGEKFYEIRLSRRTLEKLFPLDLSFLLFLFKLPFEVNLILPANIMELADNGLNRESTPFLFKNQEQYNIYIDNDRVGLSIR
jgi:hypothetical protein